MQKILMIEDARDFQLLVTNALCDEFAITVAATAEEARSSLRKTKFDLVLLDVLLPDANGFEFFNELRAKPAHVQLPVIFLTSRGAIADKVKGLSLGADDYVTKPFDPLELSARVKSKLRKVDEYRKSSGELRVGRLLLDVFRQAAYQLADDAGARKNLGVTAREFELLHMLARDAGNIVSRKAIIDSIWGTLEELGNDGSRTLDRHVSTLRKKLPPAVGSIKSTPRIGYQFVPVED